MKITTRYYSIVSFTPGVNVDAPINESGAGLQEVFIDGDDFLILQRTNPSLIPDWNTQYGQAALAASASATAVPEPTALALTLVSLCGLAMLRGRSYQG